MTIYPDYNQMGFNPSDWTSEILEQEGTIETGDYFDYWMTNWFDTTLSTASPLVTDPNSPPDGTSPTLSAPNGTATQSESSIAEVNRENLLSFINLQDNFSEQEVVIYLQQYMVDNPNSGVDPNLMVSKAMAELMNTSLQIEPNFDLENLWYSARADMFQQQQPTSKLMFQSFAQHYRNEGFSEADANQLAEKALMKLMDSQLEKMGGTVPTYGFGPQVSDAVAGAMSALLNGVQNPAALTALFTDLANLETGMVNFMDGIPKNPKAGLGEVDLTLMKNNGLTLASGTEEMINALISTLNGSNLPEEVKASFMEIMAFILEMLSMIKALIVELAIIDNAQGKSDAQVNIDYAIQKAAVALSNANRTLKELEEAIERAKEAEGKMEIVDIVTIVVFVVLVVIVLIVVILIVLIVTVIVLVVLVVLVVVVVIVIVMMVLLTLIFLLSYVFIIAIIAIVVVVVVAVVVFVIVFIVASVICIAAMAMGALILGAAATLFGLNKAGKLDGVYDGLFAMIMAIWREIFESDMEVQDIAWVVIAIVVALLLIVFIAIILVVVIAIVLIVVLVVVIAVIAIIFMGVIAMIIATIVTIVVVVVIVIVAVVLCIILILVFMIILSIAIAIIPELLLRAGFAQLLAKWLGPIIGMDEQELELALEAMFSVASGSRTMTYSVEERNARADYENGGDLARREDYGLHQTRAVLAQRDIDRLSAINISSAYQTAAQRAQENSKETKMNALVELIKMLKKVVKHLEEVLARILAGGSPQPGAMEDVAASLQEAMQDFAKLMQVEEPMPDFSDEFEAIFGFLITQMAQNMPSREMIDQMKGVMQEEQFSRPDPNEPTPKVTVPV